VLRGLRAMALKELRQLKRDRTTILIAVLIPVIQMTIFGYAISTEVKNVDAVVVDLALNESSRELVSGIRNTGVFRMRGSVASYDDAYQAIVSGRARTAFIIPPGFSPFAREDQARRVQVLVDGSDSTMANYVLSTVSGVSREYSSRFSVQGASVRSGQPPHGIKASVRVLFNPQLRSSTFFVPALLALILHLPLVLLTALSVVRERVEGTLEQLIATPISPLGLMIGKLVPTFGLGVLEGAGVLLVMAYVFGVPIRGSLPVLIGLLLIWIAASLSLGLLISTLARSQLQAVMMSILVIIPSILLSGFMFPRESMPAVIYPVTFLLPMTYAINIVRGIVIRGTDIGALLPHATVLVGITIGLVFFAAARFQKRLG